jgi:hypothetical protein
VIWGIFLDCDLGIFFFRSLVKLCFAVLPIMINECWIVLFVFYFLV